VSGLSGYPLWHAARAELLVRLDLLDAARTAYRSALDLPQNAAQREHLSGRLAALDPAPTPR
jgi:RNA polymerase sigma-70 factor (ECF subfamily)